MLLHRAHHPEFGGDDRYDDVARGEGNLVYGGEVGGVDHGQGELAVVDRDRHDPVFSDRLFGDESEHLGRDVHQLFRSGMGNADPLAQEMGQIVLIQVPHFHEIRAETTAEDRLSFQGLFELGRRDFSRFYQQFT